jgi:hypothetical protein
MLGSFGWDRGTCFRVVQVLGLVEPQSFSRPTRRHEISLPAWQLQWTAASFPLLLKKWMVIHDGGGEECLLTICARFEWMFTQLRRYLFYTRLARCAFGLLLSEIRVRLGLARVTWFPFQPNFDPRTRLQGSQKSTTPPP